MDQKTGLRAAVIAAASAQPDNAKYMELITKYVDADIESQRQQERFDENRLISDTVVAVADKLCQHDVIGKILQSTVLDKLIGMVCTPTFVTSMLPVLLPSNPPDVTKVGFLHDVQETNQRKMASSSSSSSSSAASSANQEVKAIHDCPSCPSKQMWSGGVENNELVISLRIIGETNESLESPLGTWFIPEGVKTVRVKVIKQ